MKYTIEKKETSDGREGLLSLEGDLNISEASGLLELLLETIEDVDVLYLDIEAVQSADVSFIQLICSLHREAEVSGKKVEFTRALHDPMNSMLEQAGYLKQYGCPAGSKGSCMWKRNDH